MDAVLPDDVVRLLTRRVMDGDLPRPLYALVGLADDLHGRGKTVARTVVVSPRTALTRSASMYAGLADRGAERTIEVAAERAVRSRMTKSADRVAPKAARATVRINERRKEFAESKTVRRAATTRRRMRTAAEQFQAFNAPVLADDVPHAGTDRQRSHS